MNRTQSKSSQAHSDKKIDEEINPTDYENISESELITDDTLDEFLRSSTQTEKTDEDEVLSQNITNLDELTEKLQLISERDEWKQKAYRYSADMQNLTKQSQLDIQQSRKYAKKSIAFALISFFDTLNLAFSYAPALEDNSYQQFLVMLKNSFSQAQKELQATGVELLVPAVGDLFDPQFMDAVNPESADTQPDSTPTVKQVVGLGLRIDGQIIKSATVSI